MKKCPTCTRTYSDHTLSFCLEDGALLSSAYDSEETLVLGSDDPTVRATNPAFGPGKSAATVFTRSKQTPAIPETEAKTTSPHLIYAGAGLIALLTIVGAAIWLNASSGTPGNTAQVSKEQANTVNVNKVATPTPTVSRQLSKDVSVDAQFMWNDTGLDLQAGDYVSITASGRATATTSSGDSAFKWVGPDGWGYQPQFAHDGRPQHWVQVLGQGSSLECLTGKVGDNGAPFKVGSSYSFTADGNGGLFLGVNHVVSDADGNRRWQNNERGRIWTGSGGSFDAHIEINGSRSIESPNGKNNVPTVKQMQDDIEKETKKMVDAANR